MFGGGGERPATPDQADVLHAWFEQYQNHMHTAFPGRVQAVHSDVGAVDVVPLVRHPVLQADGSHEYEALPVLPHVPIVFPRTANAFVSVPVNVDDTVLVVICESAIGHWCDGDGALQYPGDLRRFDLSHAVAIPGMFVRGRSLERTQPGGADLQRDVVLGFVDGVQVALKNAGGAHELVVTKDGDVVFRIDNSGVNHVGAETGASFLALAAYVDARLAAVVAWVNAHVHPVTTAPGTTGTAAPPLGSQASVAATKAKGT